MEKQFLTQNKETWSFMFFAGRKICLGERQDWEPGAVACISHICGVSILTKGLFQAIKVVSLNRAQKRCTQSTLEGLNESFPDTTERSYKGREREECSEQRCLTEKQWGWFFPILVKRLCFNFKCVTELLYYYYYLKNVYKIRSYVLREAI